MPKKFLSNLSFLIVVNLIIKPLYVFGIDRVIQNQVGEEVYGTYFAILKYALILSIFLDMGIENFNRRELARNEALLDKYFSNFFILKLLLGIIYIIIGIIGGILSRYEWLEIRLLVIILLNEFFRNIVLYFRANLGGLHKFKTDSIFSILDRVIMIIICGILLLFPHKFGKFKIEWFIVSQTAAYSISGLIGFITVFKKVKVFKPTLRSTYNFQVIKQLLPFAILVFLMAIYTHIDAFIIERVLADGKNQAGIYAHSMRILEICSNYSYLFAVILLPVFSKMIRKKEDINNILRLSFFLIIVPSILAVTGFYIFKTEIITLLYPNRDPLSPQIFGTLMFSLLGISTTYVYGTLLTANGNLKQLNIIAAIGVICSISLNLILIPKFKAYGAAWANVTSQITTAVLQILLAVSIFRIKPNLKRIIKLPLYFICLMFVGKIIYQYFETIWFYKFFGFVAVSFIIAVLMEYNDLKQFIQRIKKERFT